LSKAIDAGLGKRRPTLEAVVTDEQTQWTTLTVDEWYGAGPREVEVTTTLAQVFEQDFAASLDVLLTTDIVNEVLEKVIPLEKLVTDAIVPLAERRARGKVVVDLTI